MSANWATGRKWHVVQRLANGKYAAIETGLKSSHLAKRIIDAHEIAEPEFAKKLLIMYQPEERMTSCDGSLVVFSKRDEWYRDLLLRRALYGELKEKDF